MKEEDELCVVCKIAKEKDMDPEGVALLLLSMVEVATLQITIDNLCPEHVQRMVFCRRMWRTLVATEEKNP